MVAPVSTVKLNGLEREDRLIQEQLTGGNAFPLITIILHFPDKDDSFRPVLMYLMTLRSTMRCLPCFLP
jgi:hypothetical protein